jgi:hypothetical protein
MGELITLTERAQQQLMILNALERAEVRMGRPDAARLRRRRARLPSLWRPHAPHRDR